MFYETYAVGHRLAGSYGSEAERGAQCQDTRVLFGERCKGLMTRRGRSSERTLYLRAFMKRTGGGGG